MIHSASIVPFRTAPCFAHSLSSVTVLWARAASGTATNSTHGREIMAVLQTSWPPACQVQIDLWLCALKAAMRQLLLAALLLATSAFAQYNESAGASAPRVKQEQTVKDAHGNERKIIVEVEAKKDRFGNAEGTKHDLAVDGAFDGQTVAVLHLYTGGGFDFRLPKEALAEKGFSVYRWMNAVPSPSELEQKLEKANQLWLISGETPQLTDAHVAVIRRFFEAGHGLYLWGDNAPYAQDADKVARALFGTELKSDPYDPGEKVVGLRKGGKGPGLKRDHLLTTGIEQLYEGHSIAFLPELGPLTPLIHGSDGHVVAAYYDSRGRRAIVDGGFTRLYIQWDTAGTGRYVKNAAAWLANVERFGDSVVAETHRKHPKK
ncbi:MAG: hypothetical protein AMXMBFR34_51450 [Myxococcaceae bacterium]